MTGRFVGTVASYPNKKVLTPMPTGKGMVGAGGKDVNDGDVRCAMQEGVKATMVKSVLPYLKEQAVAIAAPTKKGAGTNGFRPLAMF